MRQALLLLPLALALALASLATAEEPGSADSAQAPTWTALSARPELPRALPVKRLTRALASTQPVFAVPLQGPLESPFGPRDDGFHFGIDIGVRGSDEVRASLGGTVVVVGETAGYEGYGIVVRVSHGRGMSTL